MTDEQHPARETPVSEPAAASPWFAEGLRFSCLWPQCVACCTGEPGYVWLSPDEVERLAAALAMAPEAFLRRYARQVDGRYSLVELASGDCVFLGEHGCRVYQERPVQCRTYPFWPEILQSREAWEAEMRHCPGIGHGERVYSQAEIEHVRDQKPMRRPRWFEERKPAEIREEVLAKLQRQLSAQRLRPDDDGEQEAAHGGEG